MEKAGKIKYACDIFYNQGGAVGWFFILYETLEMEPSEVIIEFYQYMYSISAERREYSIGKITELQVSFVKKLLDEHECGVFFNIMKDIIKIHGAWKKVLYNEATPCVPSFESDVILEKNSSAEFITLDYEFDSLMKIGEITLEEFLFMFRPSVSRVMVYNCGGEVKTTCLDENMKKKF